MADPKFLKFDTLSLHAGQRPDPATGGVSGPAGIRASGMPAGVSLLAQSCDGGRLPSGVSQ